MHAEINGPQLDGEEPDLYVHPPLSQHPTQALPGSPEKLAVIHERAERGECIFHSGDLTKDKMAKRDVPPRLNPDGEIYATARMDRVRRCYFSEDDEEVDEEKEDPDPSLYSWWRPKWGPRPPEPPKSYLSPQTLEEIRIMQQEQQKQQAESQVAATSSDGTPTAQATSSSNQSEPVPQRKRRGPLPGWRQRKLEEQRRQERSRKYDSKRRPAIDRETLTTLRKLAEKLGGLKQVRLVCDELIALASLGMKD